MWSPYFCVTLTLTAWLENLGLWTPISAIKTWMLTPGSKLDLLRLLDLLCDILIVYLVLTT